METLTRDRLGLYLTLNHPNHSYSNGGYAPRYPLNSPTSLSCFSGLDDLLPELWLESDFRSSDSALRHHVPLEHYGPDSPFGQTGYFDQRAAHRIDRNDNYNYAYYNGRLQDYQSSCLMRGQLMEYAQSLLPHSLFPLTEDNLDKNRRLSPTSEYSSAESLHRQNSRNESVSSASSSSSCKHQKLLNTQLYKTELCASFIKLGSCPYGTKCQFAHGKHELKVVDRPLNWRSKPCVNWTQTGSCRYGKRCCFKHE